MTHLRERWEGVSLCGNYTLERWLGGDDGAAYFETSLAPDGRRAVVKLVLEGAGGAGPLDLWHRIRQLRHPNLVELLDCGRADLDGEIVFYALFESPDDTLASALSRGPLNQAESREILDSVIGALRYLHAQGLAAGALDPDHIVAVGERVKLSTGALREAETSAAHREDVRLLGALWQRALMPASAKSAEIAVHAADPNAETRWTLAEISSALAQAYQEEPVVVTPPPAPQVLEETPIAAVPIPESAVAEGAVLKSPVPANVPIDEILTRTDKSPIDPGAIRSIESPISKVQTSAVEVQKPQISPAEVSEARAPVAEAAVRKATPKMEGSHPHRPELAAPFGLPRWAVVAIAGAVFVVLGLHWLPSTKVETQSKVTPVSLPVERPAPPPLPKPAPPEPAVETRPSPFKADDPKIWRVIAFTYRSREQAAKKAQQLNEYHPGIDATVFMPKDDGRYYLVSLGGRMTREDAERLQRNARGRGLPPDLYVQNYTR